MEFYKVKEVAEILNIRIGGVKELLRKGDLIGIRTAGGKGHYRVADDDLRDFIKRRKKDEKRRVTNLHKQEDPGGR